MNTLIFIRPWTDVDIKVVNLKISDLRKLYKIYCEKYTKDTRKNYKKFLWTKEVKKYILEKAGPVRAFGLENYFLQ